MNSVVPPVIWLHDGIWLARVPDTLLVNAIDQYICKEFSIYKGQSLFVIKDLLQPHEELVSRLPMQRQPLLRQGKAP